MRGVREAEARLDEDGVEPREEALRGERSLTMLEDVHGMLHLHARLDPESAAPVKAAIEALVSDVLRRRDAPPPQMSAPIDDDLRTHSADPGRRPRAGRSALAGLRADDRRRSRRPR